MAALALLALAACGSDGKGGAGGSGAGGAGAGGPEPTVPAGNDGTQVATTEPGLRAFTRDGLYTSWVHEPARHASAGPHATVQIYFNDKYLGARRAGSYPMPVGAMAVKEIYDDAGKRVGFAVAIKTAAGEGAPTWTWWEALGDPPASGVYGIAASVCEGCHKGASARDRSLIETVPGP